MKLLKLIFHKCIQDSPSCGSDAQRMISRIFFTLESGGTKHPNLHVDIAQKVGGTFATGPLQLGPIHGYAGSLNEWAFRQAVETYYRGLAKHEEQRVQVSFGRNARRKDNVVIHESSVDLQVYE